MPANAVLVAAQSPDLTELLAAQGMRPTHIRTLVYAALKDAGVPLKAYDLVQRLSGPKRRLSPITVYRTLDYFIAHGAARYIATSKSFALVSAQTAGSTVVLLVDEDSQAVRAVGSAAFDQALEAGLAARGFRYNGRPIEIPGRPAGTSPPS